jgi:hypothetical protein
MTMTGEYRSTRTEMFQYKFVHTKNPYRLAWDRAKVSVVRGRRVNTAEIGKGYGLDDLANDNES